MARRQASYGEAADILEELSVAVRVTRRARKLDLREAADKSGVTANSIMRVEHGLPCSLHNAVRLLRWIDDGKEATDDA